MSQPIQLQAFTFGDENAGPHLLITGGVHGDEFDPMVALRRLARVITNLASKGSSVHGKVTLVPVVNEAAFARGHRVAEDGLDLARTCPGRPDGSITERVAFALSELIRAADYYIDLHTGGTTLAVWPMTGYVLHPDSAILDKQRAMARAFNLPVIWGTDPTLPGRSLSVARDAGVPAIYAEHMGAARATIRGVQDYVHGCLNVLNHLGIMDLPPRDSRVEYLVEDPRPNSGHMQRCYPSPAAGFFEHAFELGHRIGVGELLGHIVDPLEIERHEVRANEGGLILVLRTFPSVQQGDSLAVILDTSYAVQKP